MPPAHLQIYIYIFISISLSAGKRAPSSRHIRVVGAVSKSKLDKRQRTHNHGVYCAACIWVPYDINVKVNLNWAETEAEVAVAVRVDVDQSMCRLCALSTRSGDRPHEEMCLVRAQWNWQMFGQINKPNDRQRRRPAMYIISCCFCNYLEQILSGTAESGTATQRDSETAFRVVYGFGSKVVTAIFASFAGP